MMKKFDKAMEVAMQREIEQCIIVVKKETMAAQPLHGVDKIRYRGLKSTLAQNMSMGTNQYP